MDFNKVWNMLLFPLIALNINWIRELVSDAASVRDQDSVNFHITKAAGELYPGTLLDSVSPYTKESWIYNVQLPGFFLVVKYF